MIDLKNEIPLVILMDPRGTIADSDLAVIERHKTYHLYAKKNPIQRLNYLVFSASSKAPLENNIDNFIINFHKPTFNFLLFALKVRNFIKKNSLTVKLILVGDPWESFLSAYLLKIFLRSNVPVQISIHADIGHNQWKKHNFRNFVRFFLAKSTLRKQSHIRAVGNRQAENLLSTFNIAPKNLRILPIPVSQRSIRPLEKGKSNSVIEIGIVGRIQSDRGIWKFVKLISILRQYKKFRVLVLGSGPDQDEFLSALKLILNDDELIYVSYVDEENIGKYLKRLKILVSLAPLESYGRVIRQALSNKVPIWAYESSGVLDLADQCNPGEILIIHPEFTNEILINQFEFLMRAKVSNDFGKKFRFENKTYSKKLIESWIEIINE
jgi:hypothetical protein